jgi:hypothetical protein
MANGPFMHPGQGDTETHTMGSYWLLAIAKSGFREPLNDRD